MTRTAILVGILCLGLVSSPVLVATADTSTTGQDGDWPDECANAETITDGKYNDTLSPNDIDVFLVDVEEGDHVSLNLSFEGGGEEMRMEVDSPSGTDFASGSITAVGGRSIEDIYDTDEQDAYLFHGGSRLTLDGQGTYGIQIYAEGENPVCVRLSTSGPTALGWRMSLVEREATAPPIDC